MPDPIVANLHAWLDDHAAELLESTRALLRIDSVEGPAEPNAPYGKGNRAALDLALGWATQSGMRTVDLEGHLGYAEFGQGERLVMSLGHLDVVPVGDGWKYPPFGAEIDGEYLYSRGAVDDKGPTVASFFAMRAIQACCPNLPARMRQAFGCDEESGFGCVARYMETEEAPTYGIAPDSGWPLYHAEKGIADLLVSVPLNTGAFQLLEARGGSRPNIVIDLAEAQVRVSADARGHVEEKLAGKWDANVEFAWEGDVLKVVARGKASHGAAPFGGDSAAIRLFRFLTEIAPLADQSYFGEVFSLMHISGVGLGIHGRDDVAGDLTANVGIVDTVDDRLTLLVNIRYPVTWTGAELVAKCEAKLKTLNHPFQVKVERDSPALFFPLEHPLVSALLDVVEVELGQRMTPGTMGGGTYARAIPNTVSVGTGWEGDGHAHETDERIKVDHLLKMSKIYAHMLYRLAVMP